MKAKSRAKPDTRARSSIFVESAKKARQDGKPIPTEDPTNILGSRKKIEVSSITKEGVTNTQNKTQITKKRLRFSLSLIILPMIAEQLIETRKSACPRKVQSWPTPPGICS